MQPEEALRRALRDVDLDEREERTLVAAAETWDATTVEVWCSLLEKTREAGAIYLLDLQNRLNERARRRGDRPGPVPGNSGPGW
jgi:hypothetical protein